MSAVRRAHLLFAATIVVACTRARAQNHEVTVYTVNPGVFGGFLSHRSEITGGFEVSVLRLFQAKDGGWTSFGGIAQFGFSQARDAEGKAAGDGFVRTLLGAELTWTGLGVELGWAYLGGNDLEVATHALHLAPFFSLGLIGCTIPITIPIAHSSGTGHPIEIGGLLVAKFPLVVRDGHWGTFLDFFGDAERRPRGPNDPK